MQLSKSYALDSTVQALFRNARYLKISGAQMEKKTGNWLLSAVFCPSSLDVSTYNSHQLTLSHCFSFTEWIILTFSIHCCLNVIKNSISIKHQIYAHTLGNLFLLDVYTQNHSTTHWTLCFVPCISRTLSIIFGRLLNKYSVKIWTGGFWRDVAMHTLPEAT